MSGWPILDVAIGLCFVYLLLSTVCTALTEGITTQFRSRSKYLERGIEALLGTAAGATEEFFSHPLIATFSNREGDSVTRRAYRAIAGKFKAVKTTVRADQRPSYLPGDKFAIVVREMVNRKGAEGQALYPELTKAVNTVLHGVERDGDEIKALHEWYDQVMERVAGWYKRHAQVWVRIFAVAVVVALNADTVHITNVLWIDPTVRQEAVEQAKARLRQPPPETASIGYTDSDETLPDEPPEQIGTTGDSSDKHYGLTSEQWQLIQKLMSWSEDTDRLQQNLDTLRAANSQRQATQPQASEFPVYRAWVGDVLRRHGIGWFLSMVAVSLGAPFWYSALNRLVNIRNAGSAPAKADTKNGDAQS